MRLSKRGKLTLADKQRIKNAAANGLQRFLKAELKRTTTKTYDWYFTEIESDRIRAETPRRNNLGYNRYFIIDYVEVPINTQYSYTSYCTYERVREFSISSKEIRDIISGSAKLFAHMIKITVSEKEDAKIYAAYDKVDEKSIIKVVLGFPVAVVGAVEAIPLLYAASQYSVPGLGKALTFNSGRVAAVNGASNFGEQYVSTGISKNMWGMNNLRRMDLFDLGVTTAIGGFASTPLKSEFDYTLEKSFNKNDFKEFSENMVVSGLSNQASKSYGSAVGKPMSQFGGSIGEVFNIGGLFTLKTIISTGKKKIKDENQPQNKYKTSEK
ncbi:hypothetical protein SAMN04488513_11828 [Pseudozobellia thermophila]|uniref:Uncharacterized protein n=1 Tax=Pseudozobellia thermophila TaxID=192903 RepID=A0A1M6P6A7_9FLAO|nr:hypothetical protein SAMN04488513_11828 [Pseudozobellia thermophila]